MECDFSPFYKETGFTIKARARSLTLPWLRAGLARERLTLLARGDNRE